MRTLGELPLRQVPVVEPQTALDEVIHLFDEEPLKTVVLVGDEMYMGIFNAETLEAELIPPGSDLSLLQVGPYVHRARVVGTPTMSVADAHALMERKGVNLIPVVDGPIYKGVLTREDLEAAG